MNKIENSSESKIKLSLPVRISYETAETYLRNKFIGDDIEVEEENGEVEKYAKILDLALDKSPEEDYDLALSLKIKTLTSFFRNKEGSAVIHTAIGFDHHEQRVWVEDYKLEGTSGNWFINKSLETLINMIMFKKLKSKMNFHLRPHIEKQLAAINGKLEKQLEAKKGIFLSGSLRNFKISEIIPGKTQLLVIMDVEGRVLVDIKEINF